MIDKGTVRGFRFENAAEQAEALKESEAIDYICAKVNVNDPANALTIYMRLSENHKFHTIVGYTFMKELRERAITAGIADERTILPVVMEGIGHGAGPLASSKAGAEGDVGTDTSSGEDGAGEGSSGVNAYEEFFNGEKIKKLSQANTSLEQTVKKLKLTVAALAFVLAVVFAIAIYRKSLNVDSIRDDIEDTYATWSEELRAREELIRVREKELGIER